MRCLLSMIYFRVEERILIKYSLMNLERIESIGSIDSFDLLNEVVFLSFGEWISYGRFPFQNFSSNCQLTSLLAKVR